MRRLSTFVLGTLLTAAAPQDKPTVWRGDYRHVHHKATTLATAGRYEDVEQWCRNTLKKHPGDGETLYFLALALAHQGRHADAKATQAEAVAAGVPSGRFLAGPRSWSAPFHTKDAYAEYRNAEGALVHGPMLGGVTSTGARIWVRTARAASVRMLVGKTPDLSDAVRSAEVRSGEASDFTAVAVATDLAPDTRFHYDVLVDGVRQLKEGLPSFRTPPADGERSRFVLGFGGGAAYKPNLEVMWKTIAKHELDLFLFLGDNVYIDRPKEPDYQRHIYARRQSQPDFRRWARSTAIYSIWDDHDFGTNDCAGGPDVDAPPWKVPVWEIFRQNWVNPGYGGGRERPGCWFDFKRGDVHFIMLDGRTYRVKRSRKNQDSVPTMLGPAQKRWLFDTLKASKAAFKVLASPVPWIGGNPDKWTGFPEERAEIFAFIEKHRIEGVLMMSADRHRSDLLVTRRPGGYDFHEFMSSKLTNVHTHGTIGEKDGALFSYNKKCSFGKVTFDTTKADPEIVYEIFSIDDEPIYRFALNRSRMGFAPRK